MFVRHHLLAHQPDWACGVSLFFVDTTRPPTVVVSELPDSAMRVEDAYKDAVLKVCKTFLPGKSPADVEWVYRDASGGRERLVHVRLNRGGGVSSFRNIESLQQLIGQAASEIPALRLDLLHPERKGHAPPG